MRAIEVGAGTGLLGLGVQSKALSIGNRVVTGKGGVAIVAHQSVCNPMYGKLIIDGIECGKTPQQALEFALRADKEPNRRQVAVIDIGGQSISAHDHLGEVVPVPTLIVWGRQDALVPAVYAEEFGQRISGSRIKLIDRCGHIPQLECPAMVIRIIQDSVAMPPPLPPS